MSVAVFAAVLPARESTATLLLLLLVGDVIAVWHYRRDCDVAMIRRLVPAVIPGLLLGAVVLARTDDAFLRRLIGVILLLLLGLQLVQSASQRRAAGSISEWGRPATAGVGVVAGFTTMVANAGGPVMTLYLLSQRVEKMRFLGTIAWFFFCVNLCKLPFSAGLGLINRSSLLTAGVLAPLVVVGAGVGVVAARHLQQRTFERVVLAASLLSALPLLLG
ncbi:TSUP family transporter [Angustibacter sp. McL0619]|uniref:TSUP family transporter n=1 Tax=Angustibacter sp. McL0619 TaxID=3415676 RepID=UPI003CFAB55C